MASPEGAPDPGPNAAFATLTDVTPLVPQAKPAKKAAKAKPSVGTRKGWFGGAESSNLDKWCVPRAA